MGIYSSELDSAKSNGAKRQRGEELVTQQQTCMELSGALMEFPGCQGAICSCPTRLMNPLTLTFESDLPATKTELWPIYILLQRRGTSFSFTLNTLTESKEEKTHTQLMLMLTHRVNTY